MAGPGKWKKIPDESEAAKVAGRLQPLPAAPTTVADASAKAPAPSVWDDEALASKVAEVVHATVVEALAGLRVNPPLHELADADQLAHEVEELRRQLETGRASYADLQEHVAELERQLGAVSFALRAEGADPIRAAELVREAADEALGRLHDAEQRVEELERDLKDEREATARLGGLLATAYVAREVPWTDVAAGMMTIARDGTPWMVVARPAGSDGVVLQNAAKSFNKTPKRDETVRVLVPYVTPEAAEALVASELGGRA